MVITKKWNKNVSKQTKKAKKNYPKLAIQKGANERANEQN